MLYKRSTHVLYNAKFIKLGKNNIFCRLQQNVEFLNVAIYVDVIEDDIIRLFYTLQFVSQMWTLTLRQIPYFCSKY